MRKQRILWVTFDFPPRLSSGVFRTTKIYKYLDKDRFEVDFLTHSLTGRFKDAVLDEALLENIGSRPRVIRLPSPVLHLALHESVRRRRERARPAPATPPGPAAAAPARVRQPGLLSRALNRLLMFLYFPDQEFVWGWLAALTSVWLHARYRCDLVYTSSYPESAHLPGLFLQRLGVTWVADYRYGGPLWIKELAGQRKPALRDRIDLWYQKSVLQRADEVIVQSDLLAHDFAEVFSIDRARLRVIPSGFDEDDFDGQAPAPSAVISGSDDVHVAHLGTWYLDGNDTGRMIAELNHYGRELERRGSGLVLHVIGPDLFDPAHKRLIADFRYVCHGVVPHQDVPSYLAAASCYLMSTITSSRNASGVRGFLPCKLWEYLRGGRPILFYGAEDDEAWRIIDEGHAGIHMGTLAGERPASETVLERIRIGNPPHPKVQDYSWQARAGLFERSFLRALNANRAVSRKHTVVPEG